jgi:hypothetical protein
VTLKKKQKTVWKERHKNYVKNYRKDILDDFSVDSSKESSSESDEYEYQYNPLIKILRVSKNRKKGFLKTRGSPCESKMDCSTNEHCIRGVCTKCYGYGCTYLKHYFYKNKVSRKCTWTSECPQNHHCDNHGYCAKSCDLTHNQCHKDYYCFMGACIPLLAPFERICISDLDCLKAEVCGPHKVCSRPCGGKNLCGPSEYCIDGLCHLEEDTTHKHYEIPIHVPLQRQRKPRKCRSSKDCPGGLSCSNHGYCKRICSMRHYTCSKGKDHHSWFPFNFNKCFIPSFREST